MKITRVTTRMKTEYRTAKPVWDLVVRKMRKTNPKESSKGAEKHRPKGRRNKDTK